MQWKCCSSGCKSSYDTEKQYTTIFKFPTNNEKELCIRKLHRDNFPPNSTAVVCVKLFYEHFIIHKDRLKRDEVLNLFRVKKITLTTNATPTVNAIFAIYFECTFAYKAKKSQRIIVKNKRSRR